MDKNTQDIVALAAARTGEMCAVFMIGDGVLGMLQPDRHLALWESDVGIVDGLTRPFQGRPGRRRVYGAVQLLAGVWLASRMRVSR
ncbi:hypothetical protein [Sphingomonas montana]|uniref:hypothetical protein n=1 Tax=Sphingomonas montana TaxID=1843236 RepID=UPI00096F11B0|nr:hypothetical protein [Sphingomonas montana]